MIPIFSDRYGRGSSYGRGPVLAAALFLALGVSPLLSAPDRSNPGKPAFEEAYSLEKSDPQKAIRLYLESLESGLDAKMTAAARWRLFYLYRDVEDWGAAYAISFDLGQGRKIDGIRDSMKDSMQKTWRVNRNVIESYLAGLQALHNIAPSGEVPAYSSDNTPFNRPYMNHFYNALRQAPGNPSFRREVMERLIRKGRSGDALELLDSVTSDSAEDRLMKADLLYNLKRRDDAGRILEELSMDRETVLGQDDKFRILYLLGRIERDRGRLHEAVGYFRLASLYAKSDESLRQMALASYALYRSGMSVQALGLLRNLPATEDENVKLLTMILLVEVDRDPEAIEGLLKRKEEILEQARNGSGGSFLIQRALRLITRFES